MWDFSYLFFVYELQLLKVCILASLRGSEAGLGKAVATKSLKTLGNSFVPTLSLNRAADAKINNKFQLFLFLLVTCHAYCRLLKIDYSFSKSSFLYI